MPYFVARQIIMVPTDSQVKLLLDLKGKKVGSQKGTTSFYVVSRIPGAESFIYGTEAVEELSQGCLDAVVCIDVEMANFISGNKKYEGAFKIATVLDNLGDAESYGVAIGQDNKEVLEMSNKGSAGVQPKGIDHELFKKWVSNEEYLAAKIP